MKAAIFLASGRVLRTDDLGPEGIRHFLGTIQSRDNMWVNLSDGTQTETIQIRHIESFRFEAE